MLLLWIFGIMHWQLTTPLTASFLFKDQFGYKDIIHCKSKKKASKMHNVHNENWHQLKATKLSLHINVQCIHTEGQVSYQNKTPEMQQRTGFDREGDIPGPWVTSGVHGWDKERYAYMWSSFIMHILGPYLKLQKGCLVTKLARGTDLAIDIPCYTHL